MIHSLNQLRPLFSRRDKLRYLVLLILMVIGALLDVAGIGAVSAFVATLAVPDKVLAIPLVSDILTALDITTGRKLVVWGAVGMIVVFLFKNGYLFGVHFLQVRTTEYHRVRLATRLFRAYMHAPWEFYLQRNSSELLRNVQLETTEIIIGVINPLLRLSMAAMLTVFTVALLVVTTPGIAVVGIGLVGGASWGFLRVFRTRLRTYGVKARNEQKEMIQSVIQGLATVVDARVLGREEQVIQVFHRSVASFAQVSRLWQVIKAVSPQVLEMVAVTGLLGIVLVLVFLGKDTASLVPMLALYGAAMVRLRQSIGQMVESMSQLQFSGAAIPHVVGDLQRLEVSRPQHRRKPGRPAPKVQFEKAIRLAKITYLYPETDRPALRDIHLTIHKGESVAFVGSTGSGKSTLVNIILGLLKPQTGTVEVDGVDIHHNLRGWLDHVGYIPQTIVLLDTTIRRNVAFGLPDDEIDDTQLWTALEATQLADYVRRLPEGLDTVVGERGVRLSGGQRQRVGLARALYPNPDVLIMDEATSALDNETENHVMQALEALKGDRTIIMIAHRLSTIRSCDCLFFLKDGRIKAHGTYDELCTLHGDFRRMVQVA